MQGSTCYGGNLIQQHRARTANTSGYERPYGNIRSADGRIVRDQYGVATGDGRGVQAQGRGQVKRDRRIARSGTGRPRRVRDRSGRAHSSAGTGKLRPCQ